MHAHALYGRGGTRKPLVSYTYTHETCSTLAFTDDNYGFRSFMRRPKSGSWRP
jgi:hypothetical protein